VAAGKKNAWRIVAIW